MYVVLQSIGDQLIGSIIGAILGAIGTGATGYHLLLQRRKKRAKSVESAIRAEVNGMGVLEDIDAYSDEFTPPGEVFQSIMFESNANRLGLLEREKQDKIIEFYTLLRFTRFLISDDAGANRIHHNLAELQSMRNELIHMLDD